MNLSAKKRGEVAELAFMRKAISLGLGIAKPWGDSDCYDFILNRRESFWRVQIKSVWIGRSRSGRFTYRVRATGSNRKSYTADDIDFLIVYVNPENLWYVFPAASLPGTTMLKIPPSTVASAFDPFREAWHLFRERADSSPESSRLVRRQSNPYAMGMRQRPPSKPVCPPRSGPHTR
jgi:hypothetical protein